MSTPMLLKSKVNENTDFIFPVAQTKKSWSHSWLLLFSFMPYPIHWQILLILPLQEIENATFSHFLHGHHLGLSDCNLPGGLHSPPGRSPWLSPYPLQSISNIAASMILLKQVRSYHCSIQNQSMASHLAKSKSQSYCNDLQDFSGSGLQATLKSPHTIHPSPLPPTCATPATLVSLMLLEHTKHVPISGLVQLLFLLSIALFPQISSVDCSLNSFGSLPQITVSVISSPVLSFDSGKKGNYPGSPILEGPALIHPSPVGQRVCRAKLYCLIRAHSPLPTSRQHSEYPQFLAQWPWAHLQDSAAGGHTPRPG